MSKLLTELKKYLMQDDDFLEENIDPVGYYHTILQNTENKNLTEVLNDCEKYYFDFRYDKDTTDGYTNGSILVFLYTNDPNSDYGWQTSLPYHYKINLEYDERMWGYCDCEPSMEGYNPIHNCCGNGCDWSAPAISITKVESKGHFSFDGIERNIWDLQKEWFRDKVGNDEEQLKKEKENEVKYIEEQIADLMKRKELILKDNN